MKDTSNASSGPVVHTIISDSSAAPERPHDAPARDVTDARDEVRFVDVINALDPYDEALILDRLLNPVIRDNAPHHVFAVLREALDRAVTARLAAHTSHQ